MTHSFSLRGAVTLFVVGLLIIMSTGSASANHSWGKYHWNLSTADTEINPLKLGDNLSGGWSVPLAAASVDWNSSVLKNAVVAGTSNANCDPTLGRVEVCNGAYGENGWLGIAQIWAYRGKDGHIAQGTVKLNDTYFALPTYNTDAWRTMVMCQEVGHTFGLGHQDESFTNPNLGTCMDYTNDPLRDDGVGNNLHPNAHDYEMLTSIYAHVNGTDGGSTGTGGTGKGRKGKPAELPAGGGAALNGPAEWGQAIAQDARGRDNVFVRDLGNGMEVVTHVLWVDEHAHND